MKHALWIFLLFFLCSCQSEQRPAERQPVDAGEFDMESFSSFYSRFHRDSLYQIEHIIFPLQGLPSEVDSTTLASQNFYWQQEDWRMHRPFDFEMGEFKREFVPFGEKMVTEKIIHKSGEFGMVRRFAMIADEWYLIYYADMNRLK